MAITTIFINLPVNNLTKSREFFSKLGFRFNKQFTDEKAACLVISETIHAMLLAEAYFKTFTKKKVINAETSTEVMIALSATHREEVDQLMSKAVAAGGKETRPRQDYGFMYGRSFEDLDGHIWEILWMDPTNLQNGHQSTEKITDF